MSTGSLSVDRMANLFAPARGVIVNFPPFIRALLMPRSSQILSSPFSRRAGWLAGLLSAVAVGCSKPEPIREYTVTKPAEPGALWFFKLVGSEAAVAKSSEDLRRFVEGVEFHPRSGLPEWTLPAGWTEEAAPNAVRYKTIKLPGEEGLEIAVTEIRARVPLSADDERTQANMLREQVGLQPLEASTAAEEGGEDVLAIGDYAGRLFDFSGETTRYGKTRLMAAMVEVPVVPTKISQPGGGELPFTYTAPQAWEQAPQTQFSLVSMAVSSGGGTASMTITPAMGGVLANVNRWRGQTGLPPIEEAQLAELLDPIEAGDITILYTELMGQERGILGAIVPVEEETFFVKLDGAPQVVKDEQQRFREFLESFRQVE